MQATLPGVTTGVGLFPPNSNNASGASVMSEASAARIPLNALTTSFGQKHHPTAGRSVMDCLTDTDQNGAGSTYIANGGSPNQVINGGNSFGAGGANQTPAGGGGEGEATICPPNSPPTNVTLSAPIQYNG